MEFTKLVANGAREDDGTPEPRVPSKALVVVYKGKAHLLDWYGTALRYWVESCGAETVGRDLSNSKDADGVYAWAGHVKGWRSYEGEYDEELVTDMWRLATPEEWQAFLNDEHAFPEDVDAIRAFDEWVAKGNIPAGV